MYNKISNLYFNWLDSLVSIGRYRKPFSYQKLLMLLHDTEFVYICDLDKNRAADGISLRYQFAGVCTEYDEDEILQCLDDAPCSVLEMMIALAKRCENTIMDDPKIGNRTQQWFWTMITNLGLGDMYDSRFDRRYVKKVVDKFLNREYSPDGDGGLFRIRNCDEDLRTVEIWTQLCWYLDSIL